MSVDALYINNQAKCKQIRQPVWPSGKALVSGRTSVQYRFGSPSSSKRLWFVDAVL